MASHLCLTDYALLGALGVRLTRTQTLTNGDKSCDFRLNWGGELPSGWPPPWLRAGG